MKKPDTLILIAIWQFLTAFFVLIGITAIGLFAFPSVANETYYGFGDGYRMGMVGAIFGLSIAVLILVCYLALAVGGGIGLLLNRGHEWARIVSIIHAGLTLLVIPIGTIIGTLSIIYLARQEVRDYFNPPLAPK
jgi:hypothetical protein